MKLFRKVFHVILFLISCLGYAQQTFEANPLGLTIPTLSTVERLESNPKNGTLVYDNDFGNVFIYANNDWRLLLQGGENKSDGIAYYQSDSTEDLRFGYSVSIDSNLAVIGTPYVLDQIVLASSRSTSVSYQGKAYIFKRNLHGIWKKVAELSDASGSEQFGFSVMVYNDEVYVSDIGYNLYQGKVYIYKETSPGNWNNTSSLYLNNGEGSDLFGYSLSRNPSFLVIGTPGRKISGVSKGVAAVFQKNGSNWIYSTSLYNSNLTVNSRLGESVSIYLNEIAVGAPKSKINNVTKGQVFIWRRIGNLWFYSEPFQSENGTGEDFGSKVVLSQNVLVVSAPNYDESYDNQGAAFVFFKANNSWDPESVKITSPNPSHYGAFGKYIALEKNGSSYHCLISEKNGTHEFKFRHLELSPNYVRKVSFDSWAEAPGSDIPVEISIQGHYIFGNPNCDKVSINNGRVVIGKLWSETDL